MILDQIIEKLKYETSYQAKLDIREDAGECTVFAASTRHRKRSARFPTGTQYE